MLVTLLVFLSLALTLVFAGLLTGAIAVLYRSREAGLLTAVLLLLGAAFTLAFVVQDAITETLLTRFGYTYWGIKHFEIAYINPLKGPFSGKVVTSAWVPLVPLLYAASALFMLAGVVASYFALEALGAGRGKALGVALVFAIAAAAALMLQHQATTILAGGVTPPQALALRDQSNLLKAGVVVAGILLLAATLAKAYRETGERYLAVQTIGWILLALGLAVFAFTWLTSWEERVFEEVTTTGQAAAATMTYYLAGILTFAGVLTLLVGIIMSIVAPVTLEEAEEELGEAEAGEAGETAEEEGETTQA